jgi:hypothetical protein
MENMVSIRDKKGRFKKGNKGFWFGKKRPKLTDKQKNKIRQSLLGRTMKPEWIKKGADSRRGKKLLSMFGDKHPNWKGENAGMTAHHDWIRRHKGKPNKCEVCGTIEKRKYHWANKDHKYKRNLDDYWSVCVPCHRKYDTEKNNYKMPNRWRKKQEWLIVSML